MILYFSLALRKAVSENNDKLAAGNATDKTLYCLGWTVDELSRLNETCRMLCVDVTILLEMLEDQGSDLVTVNVSRRLNVLQERLTSFTSGLSRHKRSPATHVLVTMISPSERSKKPYAVPVSCIPYVGMPEGRARIVINSIVEQMHKREMKVLGIVYNIITYPVYVCVLMLYHYYFIF